MGDLESQNKWVKLAFFFIIIGFCLLLFTSMGGSAGGWLVVPILGYLFYVAALIILTAYIFVDEARIVPVMIAFIVLSILGGILVLIYIFYSTAYYNSTKGFLSGLSAIVSGIMGVLTLVMG